MLVIFFAFLRISSPALPQMLLELSSYPEVRTEAAFGEEEGRCLLIGKGDFSDLAGYGSPLLLLRCLAGCGWRLEVGLGHQWHPCFPALPA